MIGSGTIGTYGPTDTEVTLLHWNVLWGGGPFRSQRTWAAQRAEIRKRDPDIVILSELPPADWLEQLVDEIGPGANVVGIEHDPRSRDWFRLGVCSRWPMRLEKRMPLPGGVAMSVDVRCAGPRGAAAGRRRQEQSVCIRDCPFCGRSPKFAARRPTEGRPFDAVAGDFNTPSRSIGFDCADGPGLYTRQPVGGRLARNVSVVAAHL